jgi:hypothetical protein
MSDLSAVDRLREQLELAMTDVVLGWGVLPYVKAENAVAVDLVPLAMAALHAYGDAREAAGREQGRQDAAEAVSVYRDEVLASFSRDETLGRTMAAVANEWLSRARWAARGSGVAVQPTPGSALKEGNPQQ